jgi:hypothetical protein
VSLSVSQSVLKRPLYCYFKFVWWWLLTSLITTLAHTDSEITDHCLYSLAPIHWTLLRWGGKAWGSMSYEVCACLKVQEANEIHKSQIQCQLEEHKRHFCSATTLNVSEQTVVTNSRRLVRCQSQCTLPKSVNTFNKQYISHLSLLMPKFAHHHSIWWMAGSGGATLCWSNCEFVHSLSRAQSRCHAVSFVE